MAKGRTLRPQTDDRKVSDMRITNLISSPVLSTPLLAILARLRASPAAQVGVAVSISIGPPVLPVYSQPPCPSAGYIWEPGYWAYAI
ncbi:MAG: hypothetical protein WBQ89_05225 [Candidatus Acidiferrum sp.]